MKNIAAVLCAALCAAPAVATEPVALCASGHCAQAVKVQAVKVQNVVEVRKVVKEVQVETVVQHADPVVVPAFKAVAVKATPARAQKVEVKVTTQDKEAKREGLFGRFRR